MPFPKPNRAMLFDSAGLACYIAWSFVFWNGSVLFGDLRHEAPVGEAQIDAGGADGLGRARARAARAQDGSS